MSINLELAAANYDFEGVFARPKQRHSMRGWVSHGIMTGRGFGKTLTHTNMLIQLIMAGRARWIGLIAQNDEQTMKVLVHGPSGVIAQTPPWFSATCGSINGVTVITWPNGARAFAFTPEAPKAIRGDDLDCLYATEIAAWPVATMNEAWSNCDFMLRRGEALLLWDSTPRRQHPLIRERIQNEKRDPRRHVIIRGSTYENAANLPPEKIARWRDQYGNSLKGREELDGEFIDENDGALWKSAWIQRRAMPGRWVRRILSIDPATTHRAGSDTTGMIDLGLMPDGLVRVNRDHTRKLAWEDWGDIAVREYMQHRMDLIVIETNAGHDACAANIRRAARDVGAAVVVLGKNDRAPGSHNPSVVYVREVIARKSKDSRADPVCGCYATGKVLHADDSNLERNDDRPDDESLENTLLTWDPTVSSESPGDLDALVHGVWELLELGRDVPGPQAMRGLAQANQQLVRPAAPSLSALVTQRQRGGFTPRGI